MSLSRRFVVNSLSDLEWKRERDRLLAHIYAMESLSRITSLLDNCRFGTKLLEKPGDKHRRGTQGERIGARRAREREPPPNCVIPSNREGRGRRLHQSETTITAITTSLTSTIQTKDCVLQSWWEGATGAKNGVYHLGFISTDNGSVKVMEHQFFFLSC